MIVLQFINPTNFTFESLVILPRIWNTAG